MNGHKSLLNRTILFSLIWLGSIANAQNTDKLLRYYNELNNSESRLIQYKDSKEALLLKIEQLQVMYPSGQVGHRFQ